MARYMLFDNAFLPDGILHEASLAKPAIIQVPDEMPPSLKWMPLDVAAVMALELLRDEKIMRALEGVPQSTPTEKTAYNFAKKQAERQFKVKKMPPGIDKVNLPADKLENVIVQKAATQEQQEEAAAKKLVEKSIGGTESTTQQLIAALAGAQRASDSEPS